MALPLPVAATWHNVTETYDAGELRRADAAGFGGAGSALGIHGGVVRHGDTSLAVTVDGSDVVTIQPGAVAIPGNAVAGTGCYRSAVSVATTGSLAARHATNARIDLIVFRAMDTDVVPAHGAYTGRVEVITGTPSGTPGVPTLPTMAVELARINVPALGGGAATVDSTFCTYAFAVGGEIPVPTSARLPASAAKWQKARALDTGTEYEYNGTAWVRTLAGPYAEAVVSGTITFTADAAQSVNIALPAGRFAVAPATFVQVVGGTLSAFMYTRVDSVSTTSVDVTAIHRDGTAVTGSLNIQVHLVQMTSTTALG